jgi:hypothetical protein
MLSGKHLRQREAEASNHAFILSQTIGVFFLADLKEGFLRDFLFWNIACAAYLTCFRVVRVLGHFVGYE